MLTTAEITAGIARLTANKLSASDQESLLAVFRLYLKNRMFADLPERLANLTNSETSKTAGKLSALLLQFEENGFGLAELRGGRSGLETDEKGEFVLKIRFGLALLGYDLPEEFSGDLTAQNEQFSSGVGGGFGSVVINRESGW